MKINNERLSLIHLVIPLVLGGLNFLIKTSEFYQSFSLVVFMSAVGMVIGTFIRKKKNISLKRKQKRKILITLFVAVALCVIIYFLGLAHQTRVVLIFALLFLSAIGVLYYIIRSNPYQSLNDN
mgnify:CR=1 FL=1